MYCYTIDLKAARCLRCAAEIILWAAMIAVIIWRGQA